jgi:hypothetical protein
MRPIFYIFSIILSATTSFADPRFWQYECSERIFKRQVWKAGWKSALAVWAKMAFPHWIMLK